MSEGKTGIKVFFGVPAYGGLLDAGFARCYMAMQRKGLIHKACHIDGDSLIPRARNNLSAEFLKSDCTHLLFIDTDILFEVEHVERLIQHAASGLPIVAGLYPKKQKELAWVLNTMEGEETNPNGLLRVKYAGTGFMLIARDVFSRIMNAYPQIAYYTDSGELGKTDREVRWDFWQVGVHRAPGIPDTEPGRYLSEDWFFCQLLDNLNIPTYMDMTIHTQHIGKVAYPLEEVPKVGPDGKPVKKAPETPKDAAGEKQVDIECPPAMERHVRKIFDGEYIFENPVKDGDIIYDIGANVGGFMRWARCVWPQSPIVAFEPIKDNFEVLQRNAEGVDEVLLVNKAVTPRKGDPMYHGLNNPGECSFNKGEQQMEDSTEMVDTIHPAELEPAHFYKIDTEGCELEILQNLDLSKAKSIILEWHSEADYRAIKELMVERGFLLVRDDKRGRDIGLMAFVKVPFKKNESNGQS